ncbi:MAG: glycosyltransferase family 4 protein [Methanospirillum sp.]|nr:glycosyltransferase family 4 protein [Methanospirillum sp.]
MKIALVYDVLYPETIGGVEKRIYEIGIRLAERGHEVHLFPMVPEGQGRIIHRDGLIIHPVCRQAGLYTGGRRSILQALRYTLCLFPVLLRTRVDIIDCQNFPYFPVIACRIIGWLRKEPCIITWHEYWGEYWYRYLGYAGTVGRVIERIALYLSSRSVGVSGFTIKRIEQENPGISPALVPNGITLREIEQTPPSGDPVDIIFVGRFIPEKHPELVIDAVRILASRNPGITCLMIGDGPMMDHIRNLVCEYKLSDSVSLPGFVQDYRTVIGRMKNARVFVLPSEREGFGIVCIEAMACGLPVVTVIHPLNAAADHVIPGCGHVTGLSAGELASGIGECLSRSPDYHAMEQYVAEHDWETITGVLEEMYAGILFPGKKH